MNFLGRIAASPDPPGIDRERWLSLIRDRPELDPPAPRTVINPFTKQPTTIHPPEGVARVIVKGEELGSMMWSEGDANEINVFGELGRIGAFAGEIAGVLGGQFIVPEDKHELAPPSG